MYRKEGTSDPVLAELQKITALLSVIAKAVRKANGEGPTHETLTRDDGGWDA